MPKIILSNKRMICLTGLILFFHQPFEFLDHRHFIRLKPIRLRGIIRAPPRKHKRRKYFKKCAAGLKINHFGSKPPIAKHPLAILMPLLKVDDAPPL